MSNKSFARASSAVVAACVLASAGAANAGAVSPGFVQSAAKPVKIVTTGSSESGNHRGYNEFRYYGGYSPNYTSRYGFPYLYEGCHWRKKRFFDGYGYYWKRVRVCY